MEGLFTDENLIALFTLTMLENVLGVNNVIFISILAGKLPQEQQAYAQQIGLNLALVTHVLLLLSIICIASLMTPLFSIVGRDISGRDLILLGGGLFLLAKATFEIHERLKDEDGRQYPSCYGIFGDG
ncbi:MAG: hypothetical protein AAGF95_19360 [Chloroflexota bacterium]